MSSNLIGRPIHSALCHIEAKSFVNYYRWRYHQILDEALGKGMNPSLLPLSYGQIVEQTGLGNQCKIRKILNSNQLYSIQKLTLNHILFAPASVVEGLGKYLHEYIRFMIWATRIFFLFLIKYHKAEWTTGSKTSKRKKERKKLFKRRRITKERKETDLCCYLTSGKSECLKTCNAFITSSVLVR